jgi:trk system potassium uptake protein TrkA
VEDVVVFGCGAVGAAVARALLEEGIRVRVVEGSAERARAAAAELRGARVFHAAELDADFLERERISQADAGVFALRDDAAGLYAASLAKLHGLRLAIAIVQESVSERLFEQAGIDITVNPRLLTAEEIVRFAHDPRTRQVAMLQGDRFEVLDITVRPESSLTGTPFRNLPITGSLIGAIVREGRAIFPHGDDVLLPHDRAIIFTESSRASQVERAL